METNDEVFCYYGNGIRRRIIKYILMDVGK